MNRLLILLCLWICYGATSRAQTYILNGQVEDASTFIPISGAIVRLGPQLATSTDSLGLFRLQAPPGKYKVSISCLGYKNLEKNIELDHEGQQLRFTLEPFANILNQVVVSASKTEKKVSEEVISTTVISPSLINRTNANDLSDVINRVPGVSVVEGQATVRGGVGWSYNVGSRVMVLLDGMPLVGADFGDVRWKLLPIEAAEQVEVVKGAASVLYGSSALNGSVNVITGWPGKKPQTRINVFQGVYSNPRSKERIWWEPVAQPFSSGAFFSHRQRFGQFDLVLSGNMNMTRSYLQLNDEFRGRMYAKTRYRSKKIPGLSFGVNGTYMYEKSGRFFLWENSDTLALKPFSGSSGKDFWNISSIDPHISYMNKKGSTHTLRLRYYMIGRKSDTTISKGADDGKANMYSLDYNYEKKFLKHFTSIVGSYLTRLDANSQLYPSRYTGYSAAAYAQLSFSYQRWNAVTGIRYEVNALGPIEKTTRPMKRIGLNFRAAKRTHLRATWGEGYRFPTIGERFIQGQVSQLDIFPNPDLKSEYGWTAEFGINQGVKLGGINLAFDYVMYWMEYTDLVEFRFGQYEPPTIENPMGKIGFKALNVQQARTAGMELSLTAEGKIGPVLVQALAGYSYSYPVNLSLDTPAQKSGTYVNKFFDSFKGIDSATATNSLLPYRNRKLGKADVEFTYKKIGLGYGMFFYSTFEYVDQYLFLLVPGLTEYSKSEGKQVTIHNLRGSLHINPNATVSLLINNVANRTYTLRPARMEPPRMFQVQLRVNF